MIRVVCAIIESEAGLTLACQRSETMSHPLKWEFPGGKIEKGESEVKALKREIREELNVKIRTKAALDPMPHDYGDKSIMLVPYRCKIESGELELAEHKAYQWLDPRDLPALDWVAADVAIVEQYLKLFRFSLKSQMEREKHENQKPRN